MMIKANELRIGNWIEYAEGKFIKVDIHILSVICEYQTYVIDITYPKPIPIGPEILEKAGFRHEVHGIEEIDGGESHYIIGKFWINHIDENWFISGLEDEIKSFKYLHQLQNLYFSLTGEELKIESL
jgi:hypothetical protein